MVNSFVMKRAIDNQTRSSATAEITRDAETATQGQSRFIVVVPIDAAYMTSY